MINIDNCLQIYYYRYWKIVFWYQWDQYLERRGEDQFTRSFFTNRWELIIRASQVVFHLIYQNRIGKSSRKIGPLSKIAYESRGSLASCQNDRNIDYIFPIDS